MKFTQNRKRWATLYYIFTAISIIICIVFFIPENRDKLALTTSLVLLGIAMFVGKRLRKKGFLNADWKFLLFLTTIVYGIAFTSITLNSAFNGEWGVAVIFSLVLATVFIGSLLLFGKLLGKHIGPEVFDGKAENTDKIA